MRSSSCGSSLLALIVVCAVFGFCAGEDDRLKMDYYHKTCPDAETIVRDVTWSKVAANSVLPAKLLRLHFHDCFVRGCDASVLLDSTEDETAEKDAPPNRSVSGYDVIDDIKAKLEEECPGIVSCADILTLAARDAVSYQFQKSRWQLLTGRKDGRTSSASDTFGNIPAATANFTFLQQLFAIKGLDVTDLVALSGAHTIGESHCGVIGTRLNFTGKGDADPSLDTEYAETLRGECGSPLNPSTALDMDPESSLSFDAHYFEILTQNKGLFQSDATLLTDPESAQMVRELQNGKLFFQRFAQSMKKMGAIGVLTGEDEGEIRRNCRVVN